MKVIYLSNKFQKPRRRPRASPGSSFFRSVRGVPLQLILSTSFNLAKFFISLLLLLLMGQLIGQEKTHYLTGQVINALAHPCRQKPTR